eukprot:m.59201 g.59201  ORF g.59201 m.59201 type:complete len:94 (-) comp6947_c0_seq2:86-367(-)
MSQTYKLQHPGTCTGMFWRADPRGSGGKQVGGDDWPRNGSFLTGVKHTLPGTKEGPEWLEVSEWTPAGSTTKITAHGLWMPFNQGGLLLHLQS